MEKGIILRINNSKVNFTYVEERIAKYFLDGNIPKSIIELSSELNVSPASITRFCKKIGLANYKELMYLYTDYINNDREIHVNNIALEFQKTYMKLFDDIDKMYDGNKIERICEQIYSHRIIHIFALGLSATAAQDFKFRFSRTGKFIEVIHDRSAMEMAASILREGDLVFIFTLRGNKSLENICKELKSRGVIVITITANKNSSLSEDSDIVMSTANFNGEDVMGIMSAQVPILIQIDLIYYNYVKKYKDVLSNWVSTEKIFNK